MITHSTMSFNLANKSSQDRLRIELDKQASYIVWQLKQGKTTVDEVNSKLRSFREEQDKDWFIESLEHYKKIMGVS
ncbi:DUF3283 family protein [Vibrio viridaestus]|uniref:DUF3283 family protein n=2 Tax=Vibrio viridaestus TaxID=2487322 RepID=A0A3N9U5P8_9VIBR|nr:DUF3283 family protein [Vibrio viridaestus]